MIRLKKQAINDRHRDIKSRFEMAEQHRKEIGKKITKLVTEKQQAIEQDIELEKKNRFESIQHIKQCLQSDFPKLQQQIDKEQEDAQMNMDKNEVVRQSEDVKTK